MRTRFGPARRSMTHRRTSAGVLAAALALAGGTTGAVAVEAPAYAGPPEPPAKTRWLVDSALATMDHVTDTIGAPAVWAKVDASGQRVTGKGVGVALIDSGIAAVKGLAQPGKVINGPDLSFDRRPATVNQDTFE